MANDSDLRVEPWDEYNQELTANVHPSDWQNPKPAKMYNLVVIGAGPAGLVAAAGAAGLGAKVALIEKHLIGGDCLNVGCVPSKCIIRSSRSAAELKSALNSNDLSKDLLPDFSKVMERMRRIRANISEHDSAKRFSDLGVDVFLGSGKFTGSSTIEVAGAELNFKKALVATGARSATPDVPGLDEAGCLTNETIFSLTELPKRLAVYGGGPIGCELAQAFQRLGSKVTVIARSRLVSKDDPDASDVLRAVFEKEGIDVRLGTVIKSITKSGSLKAISIETNEGEEKIEVDEVLVAVGRAPNVDGLGLEAAGIEYDGRKGVTVNDSLRTTNPNVYAAGDVCMSHKFTHTADAAARIVLANALFKSRKKLSTLVVPRCTYTDPEIAHVGYYNDEAGADCDTYKVDLSDVDRALTDGETEGFAKINTQKGTDRIVSATIVGSHAGETISEVSVAIAAKIGLGGLANVIHPYPTQSEVLKRAADAYNKTRLTPLVAKILKSWLAWQRR
jgi:pyruvate/2-oxoglutarate dehydrogenase complex dihydrolipoamide dehydrogenase (E3) component